MSYRELFLVAFFGANVLTSSLTFATDNCVNEENEAEYWNQQLKYRVTEYKRTQHRKAKDIFLTCIRKQKEELPQNEIQKLSNLPSKYKVPSSNKPTSKLIVSNYTQFKGVKLAEWSKFFVESEECMQNQNDMVLFISCAKERKSYLTEFEARWDKKTNALKPLLDN